MEMIIFGVLLIGGLILAGILAGVLLAFLPMEKIETCFLDSFLPLLWRISRPIGILFLVYGLAYILRLQFGWSIWYTSFAFLIGGLALYYTFSEHRVSRRIEALLNEYEEEFQRDSENNLIDRDLWHKIQERILKVLYAEGINSFTNDNEARIKIKSMIAAKSYSLRLKNGRNSREG